MTSVSKFWERLGTEHSRELSEAGPNGVKRRQALRYFTWRWSWGSLGSSEQFRFLITHTTPLGILAAALTKTDLSSKAWADVSWPARDRWLYAFATRLAWRYAERTTRHHPVLDLPEPLIGSPLPVTMGGRLISQDLANTALELSAAERGGARSPSSVLEIGAGYGRTAFAYLSLFPECRYTIVDIEPALTISRWYLTQLFSADRLTFLRPEETDMVPDRSIDLAVSISTLAEMTTAARDQYLALFDRAAADGFVFLKQWTDWTNPADDLRMRFDDYPIPERWVPILRERVPIQIHFSQAVWRIPH